MEKLAKSLTRPATSGKTFKDVEWVEQHREWIFALLDASSTSSEAAAENARVIQAQ